MVYSLLSLRFDFFVLMPLRIILAIIISYLLGSIPFAYLLGRVRGVDLRKSGSGNVGATNAFRVLGPGWGAVALILDILKGVICPTLIAEYVLRNQDLSGAMMLRIVLALSVVAGHNWTIFLGFKGGKGVATSLGVFVGLSFISASLRQSLIAGIVVWAVVFLGSGFVSLASIAAAAAFPVFMLTYKSAGELSILSAFLSIFIILRHKANIYRLLHNKENCFRIFKKH